MFWVELKRGFSRQTFKVAMAIGTIFCLLNILKYSALELNNEYIQSYLKGYMSTIYDNFIAFNLNPLSNILIIILPLLSSLSYSDSYLEDEKSGFIKFIYIRKKKLNYLLSKFFSNFIISGVTIATPLLLNLSILLLLWPNIQPHPVLGRTTIMPGGLLPELFYSHPLFYIFMWIVIYFLYAGAFGSVGLSLGILIKNKFITMILPFILYIVAEIIAEIADKMIYSPQQFLYLSNSQSANVIIFEFVAIFAATVTLFLIGGYKSETF